MGARGQLPAQGASISPETGKEKICKTSWNRNELVHVGPINFNFIKKTIFLLWGKKIFFK